MKTKRQRLFRLTGILAMNKVQDEIDTLKRQREVLLNCGLQKEADRLELLIREKHVSMNQLKEGVMKQRDDLVRNMLLGFASADIATTCADRLAEAFDRHTVGVDKQGGNELANIIRDQAHHWNEVVQIIDGDGVSGNERVSMYYSEIAEEICDAVIPAILDIVDRHMKTKRGKRLL